MIATLEGIDASGKATQRKALTAWMADQRIHVESFDFPHYEGTAGGLVGRILRREIAQGVPDLPLAQIIQCVMIADRLEHAAVLEPFRESDGVLILDRYLLSGLVYGRVDGVSEEWLVKMQKCLPKADVHYVLNINVEDSVSRRPERRDMYESNLDKLRRVRDLYLEYGLKGYDPLGTRVVIIDGRMPPEAITETIGNDIFRYRIRK